MVSYVLTEQVYDFMAIDGMMTDLSVSVFPSNRPRQRSTGSVLVMGSMRLHILAT